MVRLSVLVGGLLLSLFFRWLPPAKPSPRPNVLLILTDDQGWGDFSGNGNPYVQTPVLDSLARQGAHFDRFFVSPLCAPTRASLLTGRYHLRTGTVSVSKGLETMQSEETTLAEVFRQHGYATGCYGKWHNGEHYPNHPNGQGFDDFFGFCAGHLTNYFDTELEHNTRPVQTRGYITDVLTDAALSFIRKHQTQPFFCYVPLNAPHSPHQVPDAYFDKYKARGLDNEQASIYGMIDNMDWNVGRLLAGLRQAGLEQNTIVVFLTDNGPNGVRFNGNMKGIKGSVDEGGVRVPCFIRWPGHITPGTAIPTLAAHIDLLPTLVDLCGLTKPRSRPLDGLSLAPLLLKTSPPQAQQPFANRMLFSHVAGIVDKTLEPRPGTIRTARYRFVWKNEQPELYDMLSDPSQQHDLARSQAGQLAQFVQAYQQWFADVTRTNQPAPPIPVGYRQVSSVVLSAPEATVSGQVHYQEGHGWAHDWLTNWRSPADSISWTVNAREACQYTVTLQYTAPVQAVGRQVQLVAGGRTVTARVRQGCDNPLIPSPDRIPRKEAYEKKWCSLSLGTVTLRKGRQQLRLHSPSAADLAGIDVKAIVLKTTP